MSETIAYQGLPGSFGEEACRRFVPDHTPVARPSFASVVDAVRSGETALGMLPRSNSTVGPVPGIESLIRTSRLLIRACHAIPVHLHLMARPGTALADVRKVISHPMALGQCAGFLTRLGVPAEDSGNTAMAARALASADAPDLAAIASGAAAGIFGLTILVRDVHDRPDNATTFCIVVRDDGDRA